MQVEFEQSVVSGLGTVCVKGGDDPEEGFSTARGGSGRPVLVRKRGGAPSSGTLVLRGKILRVTLINRTYGTHEDLDTYLFLLTIFGPIYYGQICCVVCRQPGCKGCPGLGESIDALPL